MTERVRCPRTPTFVIAGAARSGTTSLYDWLNQHPHVFMSPIKETNYFLQLREPFTGPGDEVIGAPLPRDRQGRVRPKPVAHVATWEEYLSLFDGSDGYAAVGEASTYYLLSPTAARRIHTALPDCKIVIVLRNPVTRAVSAYRALVHWGRETRSFEEALALEDERLRIGWEWIWGLRAGGLYADQVERYLDAFPREQVGIWLFEDLADDAARIFSEITTFLGVGSEENGRVDLRIRNAAPRVHEVGLQRLRPSVPWVTDLYDSLPVALARPVRQAIVRVLGTRELPIPEHALASLRIFYSADVLRLQQMVPHLDFCRWQLREDACR